MEKSIGKTLVIGLRWCFSAEEGAVLWAAFQGAQKQEHHAAELRPVTTTIRVSKKRVHYGHFRGELPFAGLNIPQCIEFGGIFFGNVEGGNGTVGTQSKQTRYEHGAQFCTC